VPLLRFNKNVVKFPSGIEKYNYVATQNCYRTVISIKPLDYFNRTEKQKKGKFYELCKLLFVYK